MGLPDRPGRGCRPRDLRVPVRSCQPVLLATIGTVVMKRVVFVCVENSNRSQMAEAFARVHGAGKVEAFSAGSRPSGRINPKGVEAMKEVGYDLTAHQSKGLEGFNGKQFDAAVTMGCGDECPLVAARKRVEWQIPDPRDMADDQFREGRTGTERKGKGVLAARMRERWG